MNTLATRQDLTPAAWNMLAEIAQSSTSSAIERQKIVRHLLFCFENSLPLSLAVNGGLYTVNNRVEVEGTVIRAQIKKHPHYDYKIERLDNDGCVISILYDGELVGTSEFTSDDAEQAGLAGGTNYQKYPVDMYLARATSRAYKRFCPDIFFQSVYVTGEISNAPIIIEHDTIQSLTDEFGHDQVLDALKACDGDLTIMRNYLENNNEY